MTYDFGNTGLGLKRGTNIHIFVYKILLKLCVRVRVCVCVHCQFISIPPKSTTMYLVPTFVMTNPGLDP